MYSNGYFFTLTILRILPQYKSLFAILDPSSSPGGKVDNDVTNLLWQRLALHAILSAKHIWQWFGFLYTSYLSFYDTDVCIFPMGLMPKKAWKKVYVHWQKRQLWKMGKNRRRRHAFWVDPLPCRLLHELQILFRTFFEQIEEGTYYPLYDEPNLVPIFPSFTYKSKDVTVS